MSEGRPSSRFRGGGEAPFQGRAPPQPGLAAPQSFGHLLPASPLARADNVDSSDQLRNGRANQPLEGDTEASLPLNEIADRFSSPRSYKPDWARRTCCS